jgi:16S rRNA (guanine(966)-N(2))-methyltransferase RsmD
MKRTLRVVGGTLRNRRLAAAPGSRPTSERAREALFDILGSWVEGKDVLELYAGSGAVAIEALSRGAAAAVAVDRDASTLEQNRRRLGLEMEVLEAPAHRAVDRLRRSRRTFGFVFLDPPYAGAAEDVDGRELAALVEKAGRLVWQTDSEAESLPISSDLAFERVARYGRNVFSFYRKLA